MTNPTHKAEDTIGSFNHIDGVDPLGYTKKIHLFVTNEAIANLKSIRNKKVNLPITVLEDLRNRLEVSIAMEAVEKVKRGE